MRPATVTAEDALFYAGMELVSGPTASMLLKELASIGDRHRRHGDAWQMAHQMLVGKGIRFEAIIVDPPV